MESVINIYPNPATDTLVVSVIAKSLKVFNSLGIVVINVAINNNSTVLDLTSLNSGVYHIITDTGEFTKFIKQ